MPHFKIVWTFYQFIKRFLDEKNDYFDEYEAFKHQHSVG